MRSAHTIWNHSYKGAGAAAPSKAFKLAGDEAAARARARLDNKMEERRAVDELKEVWESRNV